ncbi:FecR family protein [Chitinophaga defluvii]|uniref:FecR domain-containing protein n=1 Tax=Chitinophaga defluvii TaxID=3163343 RepID=A0ABV2T4S5_9BACT
MIQDERYYEIAGLIAKSLSTKLSSEEAAQLEAWVAESDENKKLWERLTDPLYLEAQVAYWENKKDKKVYWKRLSERNSRKQLPGRMFVYKALRYAAIILPLILICGAGWYLFSGQGQKSATTKDLASVHILPQGKVAQLILANGKKINLVDNHQEAITEKDGTKVRNDSSVLSYASGPGDLQAETLYNTLVIPPGGEYRIVLSDGTKVWLNAASSLRYPTQFNGKERKVYLSGEAYFEVAKDAAHPFMVNADKMDITVLGTKFNVSSYPDDPIQKTALAEGSVLINDVGQSAKKRDGVILKPGYEAVITKNDRAIQVNKVNVEAALAWKNGMFIFDSESLGSLMRKLSRWYNIEVKYDDGVDTLFHFTGRIQRYEEISGILHLIELTGKVGFTFKDNELHVKK